MMIVIKTILNDRPVKTRALPLLAHFRPTPRPPSRTILKFPELFSPTRPGPASINMRILLPKNDLTN